MRKRPPNLTNWDSVPAPVKNPTPAALRACAGSTCRAGSCQWQPTDSRAHGPPEARMPCEPEDPREAPSQHGRCSPIQLAAVSPRD
jgi:hypothetical protein